MSSTRTRTSTVGVCALLWVACGQNAPNGNPAAGDDAGNPGPEAGADGGASSGGREAGPGGGDAGSGGGQDAAADSTGPVQTTSSIKQYGITWTFDHAYPYGTYANGDPWVVGPVTITSITPQYQAFAFKGGSAHIHGWEVNPASASSQGLDERVDGFDPKLVPTLPYVAAPGSSLVKAYGWDDTVDDCSASNGQPPCTFPDGTGIDCKSAPGGSNGPCLYTAAILTVVAAAPPGGGATSFRPPFFGSTKTSYATTALASGVLPSLAPPPSPTPPNVDDIVARFQRAQIDYHTGWTVEFMHPYKNMDYPGDVTGYPGEYPTDISEAILRISLNDLDASKKQPALVALVQAGIDYYASARGGVAWPANGGHGNGRKLAIVFAAAMLGDSAMTAWLANVPAGTFGEDDDISLNASGKPVYGEPGCDEQSYWNQLVYGGNGTGAKDCRDPYGFIDGGYQPGNGYDSCCNDKPWKGESLVGWLIPQVKTLWNSPMFYDYVDRWVSSGVLTAPDPCAGPPSIAPDAAWAQYGMTYGPDMANPGKCIQNGVGRFPTLQGTGADQGYYGSNFNDAMWSTYRPQVHP